MREKGKGTKERDFVLGWGDGSKGLPLERDTDMAHRKCLKVKGKPCVRMRCLILIGHVY